MEWKGMDKGMETRRRLGIGWVSYAASTQKVTANIGEGATSLAGGTITGSQAQGTSGNNRKRTAGYCDDSRQNRAAPGSTVKNQATVTITTSILKAKNRMVNGIFPD